MIEWLKKKIENIEVYDLYLKGRYLINTFVKENILKGLDIFQQVLQKEPNYSPAYMSIGFVYHLFTVIAQSPFCETAPKAKAELIKALEMDDSLAEAHAFLGDLYLHLWDWQSAEKELKTAIKLKPNSPEAHFFYADFLSVTGRLNEALAEAEGALQLDPLSTIAKTIWVWQLYLSRRYDQAVKECREFLKHEKSFLIQLHLWKSLHMSGNYDDAWIEYRNFITFFTGPAILQEMESSYDEGGYFGAIRTVLQKLIDMSKVQYIIPFFIADLFNLSGDGEKAIDWLEQAYNEKDQRLYSIGVDPSWDRLRKNPRFISLIKKIGINSNNPNTAESNSGSVN